MSQRNVANGKVPAAWCDSCGTILLGDRCSVCGSSGREFEINSPGDVRPCMGDSVDMVLGLFSEAFGTDSPLRGKAMFLNKVPGEDRADEVVAFGAVIAVVRFDLRLDRMVLDLRQAGAELFSEEAVKGVVRFAGMSGHLKGKAIPGQSVTECIGEFREGAPLILKKGSKIGAGVALASSEGIRDAEKAVRIRDIAVPEWTFESKDADLSDFVRCNRDHVRRLARRGVREIKEFMKGSCGGLPVTVSFSGGKDSLAAYGLAREAVGDLDLMYLDTGLEFPETVGYVRRFAEKEGRRLHVASGGDGFWSNVDAFGPPAKDFRWCCKVCKLGPATSMIESDFPKGTVTVEGNRWLESYARSGIGFVTRNPFVPNQVNLNPIRSWRAADVWAYILYSGLEYNPLYDKDFERIGCYLCPSCLSSEWRNTGRIHPGLYSRWEDYLKDYARRSGLSDEYVRMGFWRWKVLPPKMVQLAGDMNVKAVPESGSGPSMDVLKGASPCAAGGYSVEAVVHVRRSRDFSYVEDALRTFGDTKYSPDYEIAMLRTPIGRAKLFGGGQVSVTAPDAGKAREVFSMAVKALVRAQMCTECGICAKSCRRRAIRISGGMRVDPDRCTACGRCEESCMVMHYYDKLMGGTSGGKGKIRRRCGLGMDLIFGLAMVLGIGPALALMYLVVRNYTYPRVEQPFFSDPAFFGLFVVGLVIGSVLFLALTMFRFASNPIYMVLFAAVEMMAILVVMNLRRFRGKSDSVFYGYGLGLGMASGLATGICFVTANAAESFDASAVAIIAISVSLSLILGASATDVGEGIARNYPNQYLLKGLIPLVAYNLLLTVALHGGEMGGVIVYYACLVLMVVISALYFYRNMYVRLPGVVRDVLKMEGKKRDVPGRRRSGLVPAGPDLDDQAPVQHRRDHLLRLVSGDLADVLHGELSLELREPLREDLHLGLQPGAALVPVDERGMGVRLGDAPLLRGGVVRDEPGCLRQGLPHRTLVVGCEVYRGRGAVQWGSAVGAPARLLRQVHDPGASARLALAQAVGHQIACTR